MSDNRTTSMEQVILNVQTITYLTSRLNSLLVVFKSMQNPSSTTLELAKEIEQELKDAAMKTEKLRDNIVEYAGNIDALDELDISLIQPVVNATKLK